MGRLLARREKPVALEMTDVVRVLEPYLYEDDPAASWVDLVLAVREDQQN